MNLSKATLIGKVSGSPEIRSTQDGKQVLAFDVVTGNDVPIKCSCWGKLAESGQNLHDGEVVMIAGALSIYSQKVEGSAYDKKSFQVTVRDLQKISGNISSLGGSGFSSDRSTNSFSSSSISNQSTPLSTTEEEELPF